MPETPLARYRQHLEKGFSYDASQEQAVVELQRLYDELIIDGNTSRNTGLLGKVFGKITSKSEKNPIKGLYFWGGVGRGKTYLMDNFYESLPLERKMRTHFHRFMRGVHKELTHLAGHKNPLDKVADGIAGQARVLCFDEFFVTDITDAMILGTLLEKLLERGITLVATSNIAPENLYKNGLQRQRFLPAIALLNEHTRVLNVDGGVDYRLRTLSRAEIYHSPLDSKADQSLQQSFSNLVPEEDEIIANSSLDIENRKIATRYIGEDVVWFDFSALCEGPRSQNDYIEIAREFHAVLVSNVPRLGAGKDDQSRRFINMVDEFYDRGVKLILSAATPIESLYSGGSLTFEFQRTRSRLLEMQSHEYLARPHKP